MPLRLKITSEFAQIGLKETSEFSDLIEWQPAATITPMFQFQEYVLDVEQGQLRRADREIELRPKSFEVLRCLVESGGRLVSKDDLIKKVWPNVIVTDESLTQCVSEVRQAIDDRDQTKIRTVPRRGYRFSVPVVEDLATPAIQRAPTESGGSGGESQPHRISDGPSVAVLPFANLSGDTRQDYFSDGVTEDIITELAKYSELLVIARNSTFQYKSQAVDVRRVGQQLRARYVLQGGIQRAGNRVRITAQLVDTETGTHRWAERYDRELGDDFTVQDEVARTIVTILTAHLSEAETERTRTKPPAAWEAYDYYLRGAEAFRLALSGNLRDLIHQARDHLRQSLRIDPQYARAYAMLARTHTHTYIEPADEDYLKSAGLDQAHELAKKAVQLDPNLPEGHSQLGWVLTFLRQHDAAIAEFERAIGLNRNFNDHGYGMGLVFAGRAADAVEVLRANLRVDPFQFRRFAVLGNAYYMLGRYEEAIPPLRECASCVPNLRIAHLWLAASYGQLGDVVGSAAAVADVLRVEPQFTIDRWKRTAVYRLPEDAERLYEGLRNAGLPQG
jgi:adenylate cyclase